MKRQFSVLLAIFAALLFSPVSWSATTTPPKSQSDSATKRATTAHKVDLNTATKAELETLPGVGPSTANEIVAARPFQKIEDLKKVKGIGDARFDELRNQITVSHKDTSKQANTSGAAKSESSRRSETASASTPASRTETPNSRSTASAARIDLNTADSETLQTLPGVGPSVAQNIIAARPFKSVNDLKEVKGIGDARFEQLAGLVTVRPTAASNAKGVGAGPATTRGASAETTSRGTASTGPGKGADQKATSNTTGAKININAASLEELESLAGIGPVKAQAIIDNRPYQSIEDIMKVKGIKEGTFEEIKDRIRVR